MKIHQGSIAQFKELWSYSDSNTYKYFVKGLIEGVIEFWTVDIEDKLVGELYIFWDSIDKDEANGINRAYLCAFRVQKEYQGKGFGRSLMNRVLSRIKEKGYNEVTIGIDTI